MPIIGFVARLHFAFEVADVVDSFQRITLSGLDKLFKTLCIERVELEQIKTVNATYPLIVSILRTDKDEKPRLLDGDCVELINGRRVHLIVNGEKEGDENSDDWTVYDSGLQPAELIVRAREDDDEIGIIAKTKCTSVGVRSVLLPLESGQAYFVLNVHCIGDLKSQEDLAAFEKQLCIRHVETIDVPESALTVSGHVIDHESESEEEGEEKK